MNSYYDRLIGEIEERLNAAMAHGVVIDPSDVSLAVCNEHVSALPDDDHGWFWQWSGYQHVRDMVRRQINKRVEKQDTTDRKQIALPGFERERLQDYYNIVRDEREVAVPVTALTDDECDTKAEEYRKMGAACYAHADELVRFKHWRKEAVPA